MFKLRPYQQEASDKAVGYLYHPKDYKPYVMVLPTGCHAKGSKILMFDGSVKNVEDISVGDNLVGNDGTKRTVLELHQGVDEMYRINPIKGESFIVNGGHILSLYKTNEGKNYPSCVPRYDEITVKEYIAKSKNYKHLRKLYKPRVCNFSKQATLPCDPYFIGIYLGDGSTANGSVNVTTMRSEVEEYLYNFAESFNLRLSVNWKGGENKAKTYNIVGSKKKENPVTKILENLGLRGVTSGFKFIPQAFKSASIEDRLNLLAGLLDTDAHYDQDGNMYEYCTKSELLAEDIIFLCRSLGFYCSNKKAKEVKGQIYYRLQISGNCNKIPNKVEIRKGKQRAQKKSNLVTGFTVECLGKGNYFGFTIDGNHLYCDGQFFVHHNSGKSLIIADIANSYKGHTLILQPQKEILEQNFAKLCSLGVLDCSVYSASCGSKRINRITFATIGSIIGHLEDFKHFNCIIIDEAHCVNPKDGMYLKLINFFGKGKIKLIGLTATPFRLYTSMEGSIIRMITNTKPKIFSGILYGVQIGKMVEAGYLAKVNYYPIAKIDRSRLKLNSTGADYTDESLLEEYQRADFSGGLQHVVARLLNADQERTGILVFTKFITESEELVYAINEMYGDICAMVTGNTPKRERESILDRFKRGELTVLCNANCLTTGFDYPELDTVVMARPTMSLAMYYQIVGRGMRPAKGKDCTWYVDLCGNIERFGDVSTYTFIYDSKGRVQLANNVRQLTGVAL